MGIYAKCRGLYLALRTDLEGIVVYVFNKYVGKNETILLVKTF